MGLHFQQTSLIGEGACSGTGGGTGGCTGRHVGGTAVHGEQAEEAQAPGAVPGGTQWLGNSHHVHGRERPRRGERHAQWSASSNADG